MKIDHELMLILLKTIGHLPTMEVSQIALTIARPNPLPLYGVSPERNRWKRVEASSGQPFVEVLLTVSWLSFKRICISPPAVE